MQGDVLGKLALATTLGRAPGPWVQAQMRVIETEVERRLQQHSAGEAASEATEALPAQALLDVLHSVLLSGRQPQAELSSAARRVLPGHVLQLQVHVVHKYLCCSEGSAHAADARELACSGQLAWCASQRVRLSSR